MHYPCSANFNLRLPLSKSVARTNQNSYMSLRKVNTLYKVENDSKLNLTVVKQISSFNVFLLNLSTSVMNISDIRLLSWCHHLGSQAVD